MAGRRQAGRQERLFFQAGTLHSYPDIGGSSYLLFYPDVDRMRFFPLESAAQPVRPS